MIPTHRSWRIVLLLPLLLVIAGTAAAAEYRDLEALLTAVEQKAAEITSLTSSFSQQRTLAIFSKPVVFSGTMALERPFKLRWETVAPLPSVMIFNESTGLHCRGKSAPRTFDLKTDPVMRAVSTQLWGWLSGSYTKMQDSYTMTLMPGPGIRLVPRDETTGAIISAITILFDPETLQPLRVTIAESGNDSTDIHFSDFHLNPPLAAELFTLCQP